MNKTTIKIFIIVLVAFIAGQFVVGPMVAGLFKKKGSAVASETR